MSFSFLWTWATSFSGMIHSPGCACGTKERERSSLHKKTRAHGEGTRGAGEIFASAVISDSGPRRNGILSIPMLAFMVEHGIAFSASIVVYSNGLISLSGGSTADIHVHLRPATWRCSITVCIKDSVSMCQQISLLSPHRISSIHRYFGVVSVTNTL